VIDILATTATPGYSKITVGFPPGAGLTDPWDQSSLFKNGDGTGRQFNHVSPPSAHAVASFLARWWGADEDVGEVRFRGAVSDEGDGALDRGIGGQAGLVE